MTQQKVAFVTGASTGIGLAIAEQLSQDGLLVFGGSRKPAASQRFTSVSLDVCDEKSVKRAVAEVLEKAGTIDVLVNNAGYLQSGSIEEISIEQARAQFETNFFGAVRMIQEVLPHMRAKKSGKIVNVTSLAGLVPLPFWGFYNASKAALESVTETLRQELQPFQIKVAGVEPGAIKTPFYTTENPTQEHSAYAPWSTRFFKRMKQFEEAAPGPELVAKKVSKIVAANSPSLHNKVTKEAFLFTFMRTCFPRAFYEAGQRSALKLDNQGFAP